ncbi:hypothetical protein FISHEDRAFT_11570, partial [Fistulina hepatica ATCC 64428]
LFTGLDMVAALKDRLKPLDLGNKLRKDVWLREIQKLRGQGAPSVLVAVCGETGAGKSSLLNAILDDNIVPTSGMRACTAVVTEISYHDKPTIEADVTFLSLGEWKAELELLLLDLVDEDGALRRTNDLRSDAGVAWQKVHALYPKLTQEMLVRMDADRVLTYDKKVYEMLGKTKHITAKSSTAFAREIVKYVDSTDRRGKDKKKDKKKGKKKDEVDKGLTLMEKVMKAAGKQSEAMKHKGSDKPAVEEPAWWPLIRQVNVRCNSKALSSGVRLVDLPGVADANAARDSIAKDYMKKCDCIWILASIHRAVDNKTARDLLGDAFKMQLQTFCNCHCSYSDHKITFIASKCDDISCSEVIRALDLQTDPDLEEIEEKLERYNDETQEWKEAKAVADKQVKALDSELKPLRAILNEHQEHLKALRKGEPFECKLTGKAAERKAAEAKSKKRKNTRGGKKNAKRARRESPVDLDGDVSMGDDAEDEDDSSSDKEESENDEDSHKDDEDEDEDEEVTEEYLKDKIKEVKDVIAAGRAPLQEAKDARKKAVDALANLKKNLAKAQREKNAFCARKRSEFSCNALKEDFRSGLKQLDDAVAEERDPDNFDPTQNIRDYDAVDLPVFTASSRDYVRITGQVRGDGEPACFTSVEDTGIPALQQWCHQLTTNARETCATRFRKQLEAFIKGVRSYVAGIGNVTAADREALRKQWESKADILPFNFNESDDDDDDEDDGPDCNHFSPEPEDDVLYRFARNMQQKDGGVGIRPRLRKEFAVVVEACEQSLKGVFKDGLEEKCDKGAVDAAAASVETSDQFASLIHWQTYRAVLRRFGEYRLRSLDLNNDLCMPFTRSIASSWGRVFETDLFAAFEEQTIEVIKKLVADVEATATVGLKDRSSQQGQLCLEEAKIALQATLVEVKQKLQELQKDLSRALVPHVQQQLMNSYDLAMEEHGRGSVARQKAVFRREIELSKDEMFDGAAGKLMTGLNEAAAQVALVLKEHAAALANKVEVNLSVLWENVRDDAAQVQARKAVVDVADDILKQLELW